MSLISPAVYREHSPGTSLGDDALQRLIDANEARMVRILGPHYEPGVPVVETVERWYLPRRLLTLRQAAGSISGIRSRSRSETTWTSLASDDWSLSDSGLLVERLGSGTNPASAWADVNEVTYVPRFNLEERIGVLLRMVGVDETRGPSTGGLTARTMGSWSESYGSADGVAPDPEKDAMLMALLPHRGMIIS